jgi:hypothetical protein
VGWVCVERAGARTAIGPAGAAARTRADFGAEGVRADFAFDACGMGGREVDGAEARRAELGIFDSTGRKDPAQIRDFAVRIERGRVALSSAGRQ